MAVRSENCLLAASRCVAGTDSDTCFCSAASLKDDWSLYLEGETENIRHNTYTGDQFMIS